MLAPIKNQTIHSADEALDSSLFDLCISSMISNAKEDMANYPQWVETQEDGMSIDADDVFKPGLAPVKPTKVATKPAKGPAVFRKYKKAPNAPRRFKSAFIFFSIETHRLIRESRRSGGQKEKTTNVAKRVSQAWKGLSKEERQIWDEKSRKDRARYEVEVANYRGPWKVLAKRAKKPADAPKRPMSAFLSFSNKRRKQTMQNNPHCSQSEISGLLSKMWKEAPADVRGEYTSTELVKREQYKKDIAVWREKDKKQKEEQRAEREASALQTAESSEKDPSTAMVLSSILRGETTGLKKPPSDLTSSFANDLSLARVMAPAPEPSFSYAQSVARIARQQEQLSSFYLGQETSQNQRLQLSSVQPSDNLGLHNQLNIALEVRNFHHLGGNSIEESGLDLTGFNLQQRDYGMNNWDGFAMGV